MEKFLLSTNWSLFAGKSVAGSTAPQGAQKVKKMSKVSFSSVFTAVVIVLTVTVTSCIEKKKSPALLSVSPENMKVYTEGFRNYFNIVSNVSDARYKITINGTKPEPQNGCFVIYVSDNGGSNVHVDIAYTSGAQSENPTIAKSHILSGLFSVNQGLDLTLKESYSKSRTKTIAAAIYQKLVEIEGK